MKKKPLFIAALIASSLFLIAAVPATAVDITVTDPPGDVSMIDIYGEQSTYVTSNPHIDVDNIDITQMTYTKNAGGSVTCTLTVKGAIEDRGNYLIAMGQPPEDLTEIDDVEYQLTLETDLIGSTAEVYSILYVNKHCQYTTTASDNPINLTSPNEYTVQGSTLTVTIPLLNPAESYRALNGTTTFMKVNITGLNQSDPGDISQFYTILEDLAPNPPLSVNILYAPNIGSVGESLQFNSTVTPLTGQPPFTYSWKFGDGGTSSQQNPMHTYTKSGSYTYNLTVTDNANAHAFQIGQIEITSEGGGGGASSPLLLFLAVIIVIAAIGIVVLVVIIRRR